jgi:hypothetical protein
MKFRFGFVLFIELVAIGLGVGIYYAIGNYEVLNRNIIQDDDFVSKS